MGVEAGESETKRKEEGRDREKNEKRNYGEERKAREEEENTSASTRKGDTESRTTNVRRKRVLDQTGMENWTGG